MARSIYATFDTESDAERAVGALLDHGVAAEDVSFVISDPLLHPTVFHPTAPTAGLHNAPPVDAVPPPAQPLPGVYVAGAPKPEQAPSSGLTATPPAHQENIGPPPHPRSPQPIGATLLAPNTPQEIVQSEQRPHIIDMESDRPRAADGISTTTAGDAVKGAAGGAGLGIGLGVLLGIAAVMIPGIGLVAGAGALVAGLAAATGVAGGIAGGVYGYLADLGIPTAHARLLGDHLNDGGVLLHIEVTGDNMEDEITRILAKYHATSAQGF